MPHRCSPPRSSSTSSTSSCSCCRCSIGTDGYSAMKLSRLLGAAGAAERGPPRLFRRRDRLAELGAAHHRGPAREASSWSTSGRTRASTGCARSATSARGRERTRIRAWSVIGVHTPEFPFEQDADNVREAAKDMAVEYPVALDSDYASLARLRQPATGRPSTSPTRRDESGTITSARAATRSAKGSIQRLLRRGRTRAASATTWSPVADGRFRGSGRLGEPGVARDVPRLRARRRTSPLPAAPSSTSLATTPRPDRLTLNHWALAGDWTVEGRAAVLNEAGGRISCSASTRATSTSSWARGARGRRCRSACSSTASLPATAHGLDVDEAGQRNARPSSGSTS